MPRRSTREEATKFIESFFSEAEVYFKDEMTKTRQVGRRDEMWNNLQALDRVNAFFYNWLNGVDDNAA